MPLCLERGLETDGERVDPVVELLDPRIDLLDLGNAEGSEHYYLGRATPRGAHQVMKPDKNGVDRAIVTMALHFDEPISSALFDYFHPAVTA